MPVEDLDLLHWRSVSRIPSVLGTEAGWGPRMHRLWVHQQTTVGHGHTAHPLLWQFCPLLLLLSVTSWQIWDVLYLHHQVSYFLCGWSRGRHPRLAPCKLILKLTGHLVINPHIIFQVQRGERQCQKYLHRLENKTTLWSQAYQNDQTYFTDLHVLFLSHQMPPHLLRQPPAKFHCSDYVPFDAHIIALRTSELYLPREF